MGETICCCTPGRRSNGFVSKSRGQANGGGMSKKLRAFLKGGAEASPGDYILALVATFGAMIAVLLEMIA